MRDHKDWLARMAIGEIDENSPEAKARLAGDPELRAKLDELRRIQSRLARGFAEAESLSQELRSERRSSDPGLLRQTFELAHGGSRRRLSTKIVLALAAVAATLLALIVLPWRDTGGARRSGELGGSDWIRVERTVGEIRLRFTYAQTALHSYRVIAPATDSGPELVATTEANVWNLTAPWLARLERETTLSLTIEVLEGGQVAEVALLQLSYLP